MNFNINEFIGIVLPVIIKHAPRNSYYIKGGKAYDIYFKDREKSIDYDVCGNYDFLKYMDAKLNEYASKHNLNLIRLDLEAESTSFNAELHQYGFQDYFYSDDKDPYFLDIIIDNRYMIKDQDFFIINGINYMSFNKFFSDLVDATLEDRYKAIQKYTQYTMKRIFDDFDSFEIKYYDNLSFVDNIRNIVNDFLHFINKEKNDKIRDILIEYYYNPLVIALRNYMNDRVTLVESLDKIIKNPVPDEKIDFIQFEDEDSEDEMNTGEILDGIYEFFSLLKKDIFVDRTSYYKKYIKTRRRYKNIIDISWDNLTDEFKMFLIDICNESGKSHLELFPLIDISDTCKIYINCGNRVGEWPRIIKETSGCISELKEKEYLDMDIFIEKESEKFNVHKAYDKNYDI